MLLGCQPQPDSMFEQQAEADAAELADGTSSAAADSRDAERAATAVVTPVEETDTIAPTINTTHKQAIARQRSCTKAADACQSFELNTLSFRPEQPWLTSIMWQTIARILAPELPLASQDETAKKTISILFNQIAYSEQRVSTLPLQQTIDTDLVLNTYDAERRNIDASANNKVPAQTGYLIVRLTEQDNGLQRQFAHYIMLDMQTQLQLTLSDILLPHITHQKLLATFQNAKKEWLSTQGIAPEQQDDWPLALSKQWYLDAKGLHMVYQSEELLAGNTEAVDLMVPYALLNGMINPRYVVASAADNAARATASVSETP
ncbi:hypothetical protein GCM10009129_04420 [Psychrobacter aestuarii]|uniref:DUF3298 domain-containing protein n=2 Tax=Psychrobacter aestuarii TaxID=556327 RepID=A0ABP3FCZ7_9GAMM